MSGWRIQIAAVLAGALCLIALAAFAPRLVRAEMAPNFPPEHHPWLHGLRSPQGGSCCGPADCWLVEYRLAGRRPEGMSGYQVWHLGRWIDVPADRVVRRADNPTGRAVLCIARSTAYIYCFTPGPEG